MKKYLPVFVCIFITLLLLAVTMDHAKVSHVNTYPNLPAPIGKEKILITSGGQAPEGPILASIAYQLKLDADFRPRALASDLYDYNSVIMVIGYSANGLAHTKRSFDEERIRVQRIASETTISGIPFIVINLSGKQRNFDKTHALFNGIVQNTDYYIGIKNMNQANTDLLLNELNENHIPMTLVNRLNDISTPLNSAFR